MKDKCLNTITWYINLVSCLWTLWEQWWQKMWPSQGDHYPVPDHDEVEANEEPQHPPTVRHQGAEGEGLLFPHNLNGSTGEFWD